MAHIRCLSMEERWDAKQEMSQGSCMAVWLLKGVEEE